MLPGYYWQNRLWPSLLIPLDNILLEIAHDFSLSYEEIESIHNDCRDVEATRYQASLVRAMLDSKAEYKM